MIKCEKGHITLNGDGRELMADVGTVVYAIINECAEDSDEMAVEAAYLLMETVGKSVAHATEELGISQLVANKIDESEDDADD